MHDCGASGGLTGLVYPVEPLEDFAARSECFDGTGAQHQNLVGMNQDGGAVGDHDDSYFGEFLEDHREDDPLYDINQQLLKNRLADVLQGLNHRVDVFGGVLMEECGERLKQFFGERRS